MIELTDIEKSFLTRFWDTVEMREAVRKVLIESTRLTTDFNLSNAEIGERLRAEWEGLSRVKSGFAFISQFGTQPESKGRINEAR